MFSNIQDYYNKIFLVRMRGEFKNLMRQNISMMESLVTPSRQNFSYKSSAGCLKTPMSRLLESQTPMTERKTASTAVAGVKGAANSNRRLFGSVGLR